MSNTNYYGIAISLFGDKANLAVAKKNVNVNFEKDIGLSRKLTSDKSDPMFLEELAGSVAKVAIEQQKENRDSGRNYAMPIVIGIPDARDDKSVTSIEANLARFPGIVGEDLYYKLANFIGAILSIHPQTNKVDICFEKGEFTRGHDDLSADERREANANIPQEFAELPELYEKVKNDSSDLVSLNRLKDIASQLADSCVRNAKAQLTDTSEVRFLNLREPKWLSYFNLPVIKEHIIAKLKNDLGVTSEISLHFPGDQRNDQFFDVLTAVMRTKIAEAQN